MKAAMRIRAMNLAKRISAGWKSSLFPSRKTEAVQRASRFEVRNFFLVDGSFDKNEKVQGRVKIATPHAIGGGIVLTYSENQRSTSL